MDKRFLVHAAERIIPGKGGHMKNTKLLSKTILTAICVAFVLMFSAGISFAQGRYTARYSNRDVSNIINRLETSSNAFRSEFDRRLDQSSLNGTNEEDRLNGIVVNYEQALNQLRRDFDRNNTWWESRNDVQQVMGEARRVNTMMNSLQFARQLERQWNQMRRDINTLADTYDLPGVAGGGWTGGGGGTGPWNPGQGSAPNWAVGTFYGRDPRTGGRIELTVQRNGAVTANISGEFISGTMNGQNLYVGNDQSRVTRTNNGIRTTNRRNGEVINYARNGNNGGGWPGTGGNVPSWASGTFYGRNPYGGLITINITQNGRVTVTFERGGEVNYGTMNRSTLRINNESSTVSRTNSGIRTTNNRNGEVIEYFRNRPR